MSFPRQGGIGSVFFPTHQIHLQGVAKVDRLRNTRVDLFAGYSCRIFQCEFIIVRKITLLFFLL